MAHRHNVFRIALASLLVAAITITGSGAALAAQNPEQDANAVVDGVQHVLQQIDEFLETVADLLRTIRAITGGGGEGASD